VGKHTYGRPEIDLYKGSESKVIIGDYTSISKNVRIITGGIHPIEWISTFPFRIKWKIPGAFQDGMPISKGDVIIGSDVWIASDVVILSGIHIGHGAVIAAGAVVTHDIPAFAIAAGIPARIIKYRFSTDQITDLLKIRWWEWEENKIRNNIYLLSSPNIDEFISKHKI
jgi:acetyltransferase-like isoleucine patch superfamily enzyme